MRRRWIRLVAGGLAAVGLLGVGMPSGAVTLPPLPSAEHSFVVTAHEDFLDRRPTSAELDRAVASMRAGASRSSIVGALATSDAWINAIVTRYYLETLGRTPDAAGLRYWRDQIRGGTGVAKMAAQFYASSEYFNGFGGGDPAAWIGDLYQKLLGRSVDAGGLEYWLGVLEARGRGRVAAALFDSLESRRDRVGRLYLDLLGRAPDPPGRDYWAARILREGDIALARNLASSEEYVRRAVGRNPALAPVVFGVAAGDTRSQALALNDTGLVAGESERTSGGVSYRRAVWWSRSAGGTGASTVIPPLRGDEENTPSDVNDAGVIVGCSYDKTADQAAGRSDPPRMRDDPSAMPGQPRITIVFIDCHAFAHDTKTGTTRNLHSLLGAGVSSAEAINDNGLVAGWTGGGNTFVLNLTNDALTWVPKLAGATACYPMDINDGGVVGGWCWVSVAGTSHQRGFVYNPLTGATSAVQPLTGGTDSEVVDLGSDGTVLATSWTRVDFSRVGQRAFIRRPGSAAELVPLPPGSTASEAHAIGSDGTVLFASLDSVDLAIWHRESGLVYRVSSPSGFRVFADRGSMNDSGEIAGHLPAYNRAAVLALP